MISDNLAHAHYINGVTRMLKSSNPPTPLIGLPILHYFWRNTAIPLTDHHLLLLIYKTITVSTKSPPPLPPPPITVGSRLIIGHENKVCYNRLRAPRADRAIRRRQGLIVAYIIFPTRRLKVWHQCERVNLRLCQT